MKTQIRKPSAGKTLYAAEYKEESVEHWKDRPAESAAAAAATPEAAATSARPTAFPTSRIPPRA
ncbi:MAG: hypothetical protein ACO3JJ_14720 [Opitutaceae bacterium]